MIAFLKSRLTADPLFLAIVVVLAVFGTVMVYSTTSILSFKRFGYETYYVGNHLLHLAIGCGIGTLLGSMRLTWLAPKTYFFLPIGIVLLLLPFVPGMGVISGGAYRWISLGGFRIQPSEFARILFLFYLAHSLSKKMQSKTIAHFSIGVLPHLIVGGIFSLLIIVEPDYDAALIYLVFLGFMLFVAGVPMRHLFLLGLCAVPLAAMLAYFEPYRLLRLVSFLNPWADPDRSGFQTLQALTSFSSGNLLGKGLGNSQGKLFFVPQAHSDYAFSVMGEEIGFVGIAVFLVLLGMCILRGFRIALRCQDPYLYLLASGATFLLMIQSLIHILVNLALLPPTGVNLPFVSTGGSNLIVVMALCGIVMNCAAQIQNQIQR